MSAIPKIALSAVVSFKGDLQSLQGFYPQEESLHFKIKDNK